MTCGLRLRMVGFSPQREWTPLGRFSQFHTLKFSNCNAAPQLFLASPCRKGPELRKPWDMDPMDLGALDVVASFAKMRFKSKPPPEGNLNPLEVETQTQNHPHPHPHTFHVGRKEEVLLGEFADRGAMLPQNLSCFPYFLRNMTPSRVNSPAPKRSTFETDAYSSSVLVDLLMYAMAF